MVPVRTEFFPLTMVCSAHASSCPRKTHKSITDTRRSCKGSRVSRKTRLAHSHLQLCGCCYESLKHDETRGCR